MKFAFQKTLIAIPLLMSSTLSIFAQNSNRQSVLDPLSYGVALEIPEMKNVQVKHDITFLSDDKGKLHLDIYTPNDLKTNDKRPAIIFLNAIGERAGERKVKSWGIYTSWPTLMAASGYIGISMECDGTRIQQSIQGLFDFLQKNGSSYGIDPERLGVYAASANVTESAAYLMNEKAHRGIKAGVLYYGRAPVGPFRKDLPILFVISESDVRSNAYAALWNEVLKNNAPWTVKMGTHLPHAFDAFSDNDEARIIIKETISFWKNHLDPVPKPSWSPSKGRDVFGTIQMDRPKATLLLKSLAQENPSDENVLSFYANTLRESNQLDEAKSIYKKLLALNPKNKEALIGLAVIAYAQNNNAEADAYVSTATRNGAMDRRAYQQLAYSLLVANKNKESALYYEKAVAMEPNGLDYYNLACAYAKDGAIEKALPALELAVKFGFDSKQQFINDPDLASLQGDNRFKNLVEKLR